MMTHGATLLQPAHTSLQEPVFESITFAKSRDVANQSSSEDFIDLPDNGSKFVTLSWGADQVIAPADIAPVSSSSFLQLMSKELPNAALILTTLEADNAQGNFFNASPMECQGC
jgi:hypothetical protein